MPPTAPTGRRVALVTLGCGRNEVDSEELAGRLAADGWLLVPEAADADVAVVNTCGFVEAAKKDSVDTLLAAADLKGGGRTQAVVAVGCLAERYGEQLAAALPEADAVLGFDDYADISARLGSILDGDAHVPHVPRDRRRLLPLAPADRPAGTHPRATRPAGRGGTCFRAAAAADAPRRRADRGAEARLRLRPAVYLLRDPHLPRLVRVPAAARGARRGGLAGRAGGPRDRPGERELHVVRQGPRRPAAARVAAARAGRARRRRPGPGELPAAGRDAPWPDRGDDHHARCAALLRPVLPARERPGAAPDAPLRRHRAVPRAGRRRPRRGTRRRASGPT